MGDLYYGDVFGLPYWDFLQLEGLEPERQAFIRQGCLVFLFAMASELLDGSGSYLKLEGDRYAAAKAAVARLPQCGDDTDRLVDAVSKSFALIDAGGDSFDQSDEAQEIAVATTWIHERFVREYFQSRSREFSENPYFRGEGPAAG